MSNGEARRLLHKPDKMAAITKEQTL